MEDKKKIIFIIISLILSAVFIALTFFSNAVLIEKKAENKKNEKKIIDKKQKLIKIDNNLKNVKTENDKLKKIKRNGV